MEEGKECAGLAQVREQLRQMSQVPELLTRILERIAGIEARLSASQGWDERLRAMEMQQAISDKDREELHQEFAQFRDAINKVVWAVTFAALSAVTASVWTLIVSHASKVAK